MRFVKVLLWVCCLSMGFTGFANAAKCPAVQCDCTALPSSTLKSRCETEEKFAKESCVKNKGEPDMFCGVHGPAATPLALQLKLEDIEELENAAKVKTIKRQMIILHWSIRDDFASVQKKVAKKDFVGASQVIKLLNTNIDRVFKYQRQIDQSLLKEDNTWGAKSSWKDFTKQTSRTLKDIESYGEMLWVSYETAVKPKHKQAYKTLSLRTLNTAGKLSEILAFSYGKAEDHDQAAKIWRDSARVSNSLADKVEKTSNNEAHKQYYRLQAAARWNRASYHWAMESDEKKMVKAHNRSRAVLGEEPIAIDVVKAMDAKAEEQLALEEEVDDSESKPRRLRRGGKL